MDSSSSGMNQAHRSGESLGVVGCQERGRVGLSMAHITTETLTVETTGPPLLANPGFRHAPALGEILRRQQRIWCRGGRRN